MVVKKHECTKETELALMKHSQEQILKQVGEIHKAIVGNGKPGLLRDVQELQNLATVDRKSILENKLEIISIKSIVEKLNFKMAIYAGAVAVIVFLVIQLPNWIRMM